MNKEDLKCKICEGQDADGLRFDMCPRCWAYTAGFVAGAKRFKGPSSHGAIEKAAEDGARRWFGVDNVTS